MPDAGDIILITGASGFVGSAIAIAARRGGFRVGVLVRAASPRGNIQPGDEVAIGDIRDRASLAEALRDVRYLIHAAADYRLWSRTPSELIATNAEGTRCVMEEALRAGVERIVYTSSVATIALRDDTPADESSPLSEHDAIGAYKKSKVIAERLVEEMEQRQRLPAVIVNPSPPIGPRDIKPTPTGRIIVEAAAGRMPAFVDTGLNLVHVDDVAAGHVAALARGKIGERYILGGENVLLANMLRDIALLVGRTPPRLKLWRGPLYPIAMMAQTIATITGREPFLTVDGLRMSKRYMFFTSAKAKRELGFVARPYIEGLRDAVAWFRGAGYLQ